MDAPPRVAGLLLAALLSQVPSAAAQRLDSLEVPSRGVSLHGRVLDADSRRPVPVAEVVLVGTTLHAYTGDDGAFVLENVPPGRHTLSILRLGYAPLRDEVEIPDAKPPALQLELVRNPVKLEGLTISPGTFSFMGEGTGVRQTMSREDVQAVPQIGDDIFRAVNRLPGLTSNDYAAHFGIRGGRHDETLILLDGLELYEPYHLKDFNEGAISVIDAEIIDGVQLMTGGFPSRYGNKRSGVFDIASREPDAQHTSVDVATSLMNSKLMAGGPLSRGAGTWLAFGRFGYLGPVFTFIDQADLPRPDYADAFVKLDLHVSGRERLTLELLHAVDRYRYDIAGTTGFNDSIPTREAADTDWRNTYAWLTLRSSLGTRATARTMISGHVTRRTRDGNERKVVDASPFYRIHNDRDFRGLGVAQDWSVSLHENDLLGFGADLRAERNRDAFNDLVQQDPDDPAAPDPGEYPIVTNNRLVPRGSRFSGYATNRWRVGRPLVLETGVRYDQATWTGDRDVSPRVSAAWNVGHRMTIRAAWGHYRQMQGIDDVSSLNAGAPYYASELSEQWTAGWERDGDRGAQLRVELYAKRGSRLRPVFRNWKGAIDAFPEVNEDRVRVLPGRSDGRGIELYYDRPIGERLTLRASYAYSIANEDVIRVEYVNEAGAPPYDLHHPDPEDQRHAANADLTYRVGTWSLNGSFAWHTGWPSTEEQLVSVANANPPPATALAPRPIRLWGNRLPDYLRLDLRAMRGWSTRMGRFGVSLEVINLTSHTNVFGYDYFRTLDPAGNIVLDQGDETWFSIFPSIGLTWGRSF